MPSQLTVLLPPWEVLERQGDAACLEQIRTRGDNLHMGTAGRRAQQARLFEVVPKPAAWAAITREFDCGDAAGSQWLRADPAHLRVEAGGLRLLAIGEALALDDSEARALAAAVRPAFHDVGMIFSAPNPQRWYVQLARGRPVPRFVDPEDALGAEGSPIPASAEGTVGREWPRLLNDTQMALHDHPVNRKRAALGVPQVNSVWLWGAGELPLKVSTNATAFVGGDVEFGALGSLGALPVRTILGDAVAAKPCGAVLDARAGPRRDLLHAALAAHAAGTFDVLRLDAEDGAIVQYRRWHRLRFWRRP